MNEESDKTEETPAKKWTKSEIFTIITFYFTNFSVGIYYSLLGPFFPQEAAKKGMTTVMTGVVFSVFELVMVVAAPFFGAYLTTIGAKRLYVMGLLVTSISSAAFGFLEYCPPGTLFIVMCVGIRIVEGVGAVAFQTACYSIMALTFPNRLATVMGYFELFSGLGLMVGPPFGGFWFKIGGFKMPFVVTASVNTVIAVFSIFLVPNPEPLKKVTSSSIYHVLKIPVVLIMATAVFAGFACLTFINVGLALRLEAVYHFKPLTIGFIFLVGPGLYAISSPVWGFVSDRLPQYSLYLMIFGSMLTSVGFFFMGPAPFLSLPHDMLGLLLICLAAMGIGLGSVINAFQIMTKAAVKAGMPEDLETYGIISSIFSMALSGGAFTGPLLGGYLLDTVQFAWASFIFGCLTFTYASMVVVYVIVQFVSSKVPAQQEQGETEFEDEKTALVRKPKQEGLLTELKNVT